MEVIRQALGLEVAQVECMSDKFYFSILILFLICFSGLAQTNPLEQARKRAESFRAESKYDSALLLFQEIGLKAKGQNNLKYQTAAAMGLGGLYIDLSQADLAIESYRKAGRLAEESRDQFYVNSAYFGIGAGYHLKWYNNKGLTVYYDSAVYYYTLTSDQFINAGQKREAAELLYNVSMLNTDKKEYEKAEENLDKVVEIQKEISDTRGIARSLKQYGYIFYKKEIYDSAESYYRRSLAITDSAKYLDDGLNVLNLLAELYEKQNNFKKAIEYRKEYYTESKEIYTEDYNDKLLELREEYNTASLELEAEKQKNLALEQKRIKVAAIIIGVASVIIISIWLYVVDQRRKNIKILAAKNDEINKQKIDDLLQDQEIASLQGVLEGQETERKRVAIDLHDRLGGILSMVKLHFSAVEEKIDEESPNKKKFLTASELLDLAAGEVRNISHNLMSGVLAKFGLLPALEDLRTRISDTGKLKVNLFTNNFKGSLEGEQELQLYRIVQELMSNILKHSEAKETNIQLTESEGNVNLIVEDDGVGFNPEKLGKKSGIGLSNLKARVAKLDGTFHIDSGKGAGTTISIDIPVTND